MRIYPGKPRRHYEEALRSMGLILDAEGYRHVVVVEVDDAFMVTGLRYSTSVSRAAESVGRWACVATRFIDDEIGAMPDIGIARRGSGHRALDYEKALRLIGLWIDEHQASRVTITDQAGTYLVRALPHLPADPPFLTVGFSPDALETMAGKRSQERRDQGRGWRR